jgi:hypothetical protein
MKRIAIPRSLLVVSMVAISGCVANPVLAPSCPEPAPLDGKYDHRAPGYIIQFRDDVRDVSPLVHNLALKYSFNPTAIYETAIKGFGVSELQAEALAGLRCEPGILRISFNERTTVAYHAL